VTAPSVHQGFAHSIIVWKPSMTWVVGPPNTNTWTPEGEDRGSITGEVESYKHVLRALGGYWSAEFTVNAEREYIEEWLDERLGWHIEVHDEAGLTMFEGFVNEIDAVMGGFAVTRGPLLQAANKVDLAYSTVDTTTTPPTVGIRAMTGIQEDNAQQQKYGIIETILSAGGCTAAEALQVRRAWLADNARPRTTMRWSNPPAGRTAFTVRVLGYVHLMDHYIYSYTAATGTQNLEEKLGWVLDDDPNDLLNSTTADITVTGASITVRQYDDKQRTAWAIVKDLVARGDAEFDRYVFGVWANRRVVYAQAPDTVDYHVRIADVAQRVETPIGVEVYPWAVLPGRWALFTDFLVARTPPTADPRQDPRALFIEQATYTAPWSLDLQGGRADRTSQMLAQLGLSGVGG